jgi:hypothetical protein
MSEIDDLIARSKALVQSHKKPAKKGRNTNDIFIYQNRPVSSTDWTTATDVTFISIYNPTKLPEFPYSVVLHKHTVFDTCDRNRYCHKYGWEVPDIHRRSFDYIWGYLYSPGSTRTDLQLKGINLSYE